MHGSESLYSAKGRSHREQKKKGYEERKKERKKERGMKETQKESKKAKKKGQNQY